MPQDRPNILFFLVDQLRMHTCTCHGGENIQTPAIDSLARSGLRFTNAISNCPLCTPYRGMLMTGRYPTHSGIVKNFVNVSAQQNPDCIAVLFQRSGYRTGYIGKWHLNSKGVPFPPQGDAGLGFDWWAAYNFHMDMANYWYQDCDGAKHTSKLYETDCQTEQAIRFIAREPDRPFFLVVSPHPPHPPYTRENSPAGADDIDARDIVWSENVPEQNPRTVDEMRCYLAMVKNIDDNIGKLMAFLDETGQAENTLVVFTSDHGEMHGSHGRLHKMVPYSEAVRVPLLMRWSGRIAAGQTNDTIFQPMDFLPTFCALARVEMTAKVDGRDLSGSVLANDNTRANEQEALMMNYTSHWNHFSSETPQAAKDWRCWPEWRGVFTGRHTYVRWLSGQEELYDNQADPLQFHNLADTKASASLQQRLRAQLQGLLAQAHDEFLCGRDYAKWYDKGNLVATALGRVTPPQGDGR